MFRKTKRKIVFAVVFSLLILMLVTLLTIYLSNRHVNRRENEKLLRTYVEQYSPDRQPLPQFDQEKQPDPKPDQGFGPQEEGWRDRDEPRFHLSTFYSVAYDPDGNVLTVDNGNNALQSEADLIGMADSILQSGKKSGKTGNLLYLVEKRSDYTLVAMLDGTITDDTQSALVIQMLVIGSLAMVILAVVAFFVARGIVAPLEENDRRQKQFVSDAGHELKTPIAVISANTELLTRQFGNSEWLDNIEYENERMSELVRQLLVLSRAENREMPREELDFSKLVGGEVLPFESLAFEKGKTVQADVTPDLFVTGNANQLRQLVSILLDNALEHGTGEQIQLSLKKDKHMACLSVSNEAPAMTEEQLGHLFDRFYRAEEARTDQGSHYGLGLSIAKAVALAHGGTIRADFRQGSLTFTFSMPLKKI
ncbi:MAG: HAMP domain-containing histidine kinase [Clostridia bacterium]|nr:HAMP domain-containing histidine kinase [Clostridia bacterium]